MSLIKVGWRHLLRRPWQSILMLAGIALGVAVAVAIDLANASASRAFDLSTEAVVGRATHQITGGPSGLDEQLYTRLLRSGALQTAAPVLTAFVSSPRVGNYPLQLLGIDPFADRDFRSYFGEQGLPLEQLTGFLTRPGAILLSQELADRYGLKVCPAIDQTNLPDCKFILDIDGRQKPVWIAGLLETTESGSPGRLSQRALEEVLLADLSTAQELTGRIGYIDRIDLILPESCPQTDQPVGRDCQQIQDIESLLPLEAVLAPVSVRAGSIQEMTAAFRLNLTALSLLALVVGLFLIYNTMTFSVVQRRPLFGTLRCLGFTREEVLLLVLGEAFLVGLLGAVLGVLLGVIMGQGAVRLVTQTINDLYYVVNVRGIQVPLSSLVKGVLLGVGATLLTAGPPAWEAASVPPRAALSRAGLESKTRQAVWWAAGLGCLLLLLGTLLLFLPTKDLVVSFAGTFAVVVGFAMLTPLSTEALMSGTARIAGRVWGTIGRMAPRNVVNGLSRTGIAIAALTVAVSVTIGVNIMVTSFRQTVVSWLDQTLQGDIYISLTSPSSTRNQGTIDPQVLEVLRGTSGIQRIDVLRTAMVNTPRGSVQVAATDNPQLAEERIFLSSIGTPAMVAQALRQGSVLVSEPFANRTNLPHQGRTIQLITKDGVKNFNIAGIYYDYASSQGTVLMDLQIYRELWGDEQVNAIALRLESGKDPDQMAQSLRESLSNYQQLLIRPNQILRQEALAVFDRTFAITGALQLLATIVAFIGIVSALLSLQLEKQREMGILRAIGMTPRQLWGLIVSETGLMGVVAGLLALPAGFLLAWILIYIINRRSFGWTLQMQVPVEPFLQALAIAISAAILAAIYPAFKVSRMWAAEALRSE
jgi:putative ABC transport system permease protein